MKKLIIIYFLISVFGLSCSPDPIGFGGNGKISGRINILPNPFSNKDSISASFTDIFVGFNSKPNSENYNYKLKSDTLGNFSLNHIFEGNEYFFSFLNELKLDNQTILFKLDTILASGEEHNLIINKEKNFLRFKGIIKMKDSKSSNLLPVKDANIYIGNGYIPSSTNYTFKLSSNENGEFVTQYFKLLDITQINIYVTYNKDLTEYSSNLNLKDLNELNNIIELKRKSNEVDLSGYVYFYDYSSNEKLKGLPKVKIFVGYDFLPTPNNYSFLSETSDDGYFILKNLNKDDLSKYKYNFLTTYSLDDKNIILSAKIDSSKNLNSVILNPNNYPGIVSLYIRNSEKIQEANYNVCLYTNEIILKSNKLCEGSIFKSLTNSYGKAYAVNIPEGSYYFKGYSLVNSDSLINVHYQKININNSFPQSINIDLK